jgi:hypothetical protein
MKQNRQPINIASLFADNGIEFQSSANGWVNTACPFCDDSGNHLGYPKDGGLFTCWKCGTHKEWGTIAALLGISIHQAADVCKQYKTPTKMPSRRDNALQGDLDRVLTVKMPYSTGPMTGRHKDYLRSRGFDPDRLEVEWGLLGTGAVGPFAHRIIIPIHDRNGNLVCFRGRDIPGLSPMRYKSCPDRLAAVDIKNCVYGLDRVKGDTIVIVEGAAKVWRLGSPACATFGATVTDAQLILLKQFRHRCIVFDGDETGREKAKELAKRLAMFDGSVLCYDLPDGVGPDDLTTKEAASFMKEII